MLFSGVPRSGPAFSRAHPPGSQGDLGEVSGQREDSLSNPHLFHEDLHPDTAPALQGE